VLNDVVYLDLETTGGSAQHDRIIEIGLVEIRNGELAGEWTSLVNPHRPIPRGIQALTGITDEMVASAPAFEGLSASLAQRLEGKTIAAHNAAFDYGFLRREFARSGMRYSAPVICTVKLARRLFPRLRRHNLDALLVRHAIFCADRHRALGDARVLWQLAQLWRHDPGAEAVERVSRELAAAPALPRALSDDVVDALPETPGAYVFHGADGAALYVGSSANLRVRVLAHFAGAGQTPRDALVAERLERVEWTVTPGVLGAHLLARKLVDALAPVYNRAAHRQDACAWRWCAETPHIAPQLVTLRAADFADDGVYGAFASRQAARAALRRLAREHALCERFAGLETKPREGPCRARAAQRCRGACVGSESALSHAMRLAQVLAGLRLRAWPYPGAIGVRERDRHTGRTELHVFDRWLYLGAARSEAELDELDAAGGSFDLDAYNALARKLSQGRTRDIVPLCSGGS